MQHLTINMPLSTDNPAALATVYLGGGCFWCTEAVFTRVRGVLQVQSGYANGHTENPSYDDICTGNTGHAEVIAVRYHPQHVSLEALLEIFFATHDPTTLNRQGNDVGTQYRSAIYTDNAQDLASAQAALAAYNQAQPLGAAAVTEVAPLQRFWPAEDWHQDYFAHNPQQGYCTWVVAPKVAHFLAQFPGHSKGTA